MVQGWFPSPTACAPILPTTQVRKRWHRRVLNTLNQLTPQEFMAVLSVVGIVTILFGCIYWLSCPPLSQYVFTHCAARITGREVEDSVDIIADFDQSERPVPLHISHGDKPVGPTTFASSNATAHVELTSLGVTQGTLLRPKQELVFGQHRYRVASVAFEHGHDGAAVVNLERLDKEKVGVQAPVDENEAKEDIMFGVGPAARDKYQKVVETEKFECLSGGKLVQLPSSKINDDYCDCSDGSDEPGTSACQGNNRFYCAHTGKRKQFVWSVAVNDGVCDCCDGSDESTSGVTCPHLC
eukprot:TRINITY_DN27233_c0_g1_i1.p1 TRINITY_DN27233_c0_g1~~TRINITY_DN27233_c0_g1_i1.p1  ORF type:complete len:297 (+),score=51.36 TRINITY_DN27233_c0_g1_i1:133-1023(+)